MMGWLRERLPIVLPYGWTQEVGEDGCRYVNHGRRLVVIVSGAVEEDGKRWAHFSASHAVRIPDWDELVELKELFLGRETTALQVLAPRSKWVNINPNVLHLWVCADGDAVPDFTRGTNSL